MPRCRRRPPAPAGDSGIVAGVTARAERRAAERCAIRLLASGPIAAAPVAVASVARRALTHEPGPAGAADGTAAGRPGHRGSERRATTESCTATRVFRVDASPPCSALLRPTPRASSWRAAGVSRHPARGVVSRARTARVHIEGWRARRMGPERRVRRGDLPEVQSEAHRPCARAAGAHNRPREGAAPDAMRGCRREMAACALRVAAALQCGLSRRRLGSGSSSESGEILPANAGRPLTSCAFISQRW